ncbi:MAG: hypothetical protein KKH85_09150 [Proteobacteria bacterium]|nr:hypothetical protein [Pseudomonadota bacterium]
MSTVNYENIFDRGMLINLKMGSWAARNKLSQEDLKDLPTPEEIKGLVNPPIPESQHPDQLPLLVTEDPENVPKDTLINENEKINLT